MTATPAAASIDLATLEAADTAVLPIRDKKGDLLTDTDEAGTQQQATVTIYGPGSKQYQAAQTRAHQRTQKLIQKFGRKALENRSADDIRADSAELLADLTVSFDHIGYRGLEGRELAVGVYNEPKLGFITAQVNSGAVDWANF